MPPFILPARITIAELLLKQQYQFQMLDLMPKSHFWFSNMCFILHYNYAVYNFGFFLQVFNQHLLLFKF
jgi:hypothetical protein